MNFSRKLLLICASPLALPCACVSDGSVLELPGPTPLAHAGTPLFLMIVRHWGPGLPHWEQIFRIETRSSPLGPLEPLGLGDTSKKLWGKVKPILGPDHMMSEVF
jgi:hypothetical protein